MPLAEMDQPSCCAKEIENADHGQNAHEYDGEAITKLVAEYKIDERCDRQHDADNQKPQSCT